MLVLHVLLCFLLTSNINPIVISSIRNTIFVPLRLDNSIIKHNITCEQCLCQLTSTYSMLNCFPNNTCQLFSKFPCCYQLETFPRARLLLFNQSILNYTRCCMPHVTEVIDRLDHFEESSTNDFQPRCLMMSKQGWLVTVYEQNRSLIEYHPTNLTVHRYAHLNLDAPLSVAEYDGFYYIGSDYQPILVLNIDDLKVTYKIDIQGCYGIRDIIFLNEGRMMIAASSTKNALVVFDHINGSPGNYTFRYHQDVKCIHTHGLLYINDTLFYATSWDKRSIYSYSAINSSYWQETLFFDTSSHANDHGGGHLVRDEYGRFWFAVGSTGFVIVSHQGKYIITYKPRSSSFVFDAVLTKNYVLYISNWHSNRHIIRFDPRIDLEMSPDGT